MELGSLNFELEYDEHGVLKEAEFRDWDDDYELYKFAYEKILEGKTEYTLFFYYDKEVTDTLEKFMDENCSGWCTSDKSSDNHIHVQRFISPHSNSDIRKKPINEYEFRRMLIELSCRFPDKLFTSSFQTNYEHFVQYALGGKSYFARPKYPNFSLDLLNKIGTSDANEIQPSRE